ncbi:MAG: tetratricopeptide repeat protein [Deltaproteobacteria bacterium]|nr:tetratricopeptide repeat protein [Deltaproteobacteria bacterium]
MLNKLNISQSKKKLIVYIVLAVVTFAVFWQVNQYEFINLDDTLYVTENSHIQSGITLEGFRWAFSTRYADLWNPLVWLSFMLDYQLYGLNASGYHVTNLILHIMSTLLLFWLFCRMTGAVWKSAFVAALFALHPLHVESVAWIAERKDVLSAFFWMLTLCLYVYYTEKPVIRRYLLVLFSFALALMSKPMVVTLPIIMILLDYWPLKRFESQKGNLVLWQLKEKIPFFVLSAALAIVTIYAPPDNLPHKLIPLEARIANAPVAFVTYLEKTFWPHDMAIFYPFSVQIPLWQILGATLLILAISAAVIVMAKRLPYLFVGWLWFAITLLPVIGIIQLSAYSMADHYHYLPSVGIAIMLAWGIPSLIKSEEIRKNLLFPTGIIFLTIMALLSWNQCGYWKNSIKLFNHALRVTKNNTMVNNLLGSALFKKGKIGEAIDHYNKAILIAPDYIYAYGNRGKAYAKLGQYQRAIEDYTRAISLKTDYAEGYYTRGTAYGKLLGQYKLSLDDFNEAIRLKPDYIDAYNNRGIVYTKLGMYQKATDDFNEAIHLKPDYADAYNNRAVVYLTQGDSVSGCPDAQKACDLGNCAALKAANAKGLCR